MKDLLLKLIASQELSFEEARQMILWIMSEEAISVQAAALLALLQAKGVTVDEMAGAAQAMREKAKFISAPKNSIDTCSTGGNGIVVINGVFLTPTTITNPENNFSIIDPESKRYLSEDYYFTRKWKELGGELWVFPHYDLTHVGTWQFKGSLVRKGERNDVHSNMEEHGQRQEEPAVEAV